MELSGDSADGAKRVVAENILGVRYVNCAQEVFESNVKTLHEARTNPAQRAK